MEIDYLLLAEHAEVTGSKLYLMGGGWDTMNVPDVPAHVRLNLAAGVRVGWDETNTTIPLVVRVDDDDAQEVFRLDGQMNVGRPPQLLAGYESTLADDLRAAAPAQIRRRLPNHARRRATGNRRAPLDSVSPGERARRNLLDNLEPPRDELLCAGLDVVRVLH